MQTGELSSCWCRLDAEPDQFTPEEMLPVFNEMCLDNGGCFEVQRHPVGIGSLPLIAAAFDFYAGVALEAVTVSAYAAVVRKLKATKEGEFR